MVHIVLIRRAVWTLLFCITSTLAADSYHPHIVKSQVVVLDAKAIEGAANRGTPFELVFGGTHLKVVLAPAPVWTKEGLQVLEVDEKGGVKQSIVQGNITYAGEVVGEDPAESEVRFTIVRGVLDGYVLSATGWWFIEPLSRFDPKASIAEYLVYATRDLDFVLDYGDDDAKLDRVFAPPSPRTKDGRIGLDLVADLAYVCLRGDGLNFHERHAKLVNDINGIYKAQTGREFKIVKSVSDAGGAELTSSSPLTLLNQFNVFVGVHGVLSGSGDEIAHLTTGKNLNGDVLGIAQRRGNVGLSQQAVVRVNVSGVDYVLARMLEYQNMMVAAHELGHNFDGDHGEADKWCVWDTFLGCLDYERTIMWSAFYPDNNARFSDGTRNPLHNNKKRIVDFMTMHGF